MNISKELAKKSFSIRENKFFLINSIIIISTFVIDRIFKVKIINQVDNGIIYVNDYVNFDLVWNTGVGFGFLSSNSSVIYNSISILIGFILIFIVFLIYKSERIDKILFSLILGGALGNFYDRINYNAVPDFIDIHYQTFHWFTFNMADIFISIGIIILITKDILITNEK